MCQHFKDRANRTQSESSLSNFAEVKPIFEAMPQRSPQSHPPGIGLQCKSRYRFSIGDKKRSKLLCTKAKKIRTKNVRLCKLLQSDIKIGKQEGI